MLLVSACDAEIARAAEGGESPAGPAYVEEIELLTDLCFRCHGAKRAKGDLNLESAVRLRPLVRERDLWINVLARIKDQDMPPKDAEQPTEEERRQLVAWLDRAIHHFDYSQVNDPGYEPVRRLSHNEYHRSIQDLFGIPIQPGDSFPDDLSGTSGFDNSANTLFIQTILMERYFGAADHAINQALPERVTTPEHATARATVFVATPDATTSNEQAARTILERFLSRAYRRPADEGEVDEIVGVFRRAMRDGATFETAVKRALNVVLVSPNFLLRLEAHRATDEPYEIDEWELASRLSYFLWASMPDDELFALAEQKKLREPGVLDQQLHRMLANPKSMSLGNLFAAQWLGFRILGTRVRLDPIDNPWCTDTLMTAMREETSLFFHSLVQANAPLSRLIDAEYTFLNEELANHYEIEGVKGTEMRRVALTNPNRGGVFGQGSVLAITSFPGRTSPVVRGKWILTDLLGTPPPPPPPNAGEFTNDIRTNRKLTARQKLEMHRENPTCNACHSQIDPLGFGLENFDWFGRWRTDYRGRRRGGEKRPIDAHGRLPDGTEFNGPAELKKVIVEKRLTDLGRQVTRKMLAYALGRQLEYYDETAVLKIIAAAEPDDYRFHTLIREIIHSFPFQYKQNRSSHEGAGAP